MGQKLYRPSQLIYTKTPTGVQYNKVCEKLIEKYPQLKDDIGTSGYVSIPIIVILNVHL